MMTVLRSFIWVWTASRMTDCQFKKTPSLSMGEEGERVVIR
jgi:hypothetical protein